MWNPEKYLNILMYRATPSQGARDSLKNDLLTFYSGPYAYFYSPILKYNQLEQNNIFEKCYHVTINWMPLTNGVEIDSPPNLLTSIDSAFREDENLKPILVPTLQEPSSIDEVFYTDNVSDLPKLCCAVFSCITQQNTKFEISESDEKIVSEIEKMIRVISGFKSQQLEKTQERQTTDLIKNEYIPKLKQYFMLTDPVRQQKIIDVLRNSFQVASPEKETEQRNKIRVQDFSPAGKLFDD